MSDLGLGMMGKDPDGNAKALTSDNEGNLGVTLNSLSGRTVKVLGEYNSVTLNTQKFNTLTLNVRGNDPTINVRGRKETTDEWDFIKPMTEQLFLLDSQIDRVGKYYFDVSFYQEVNVSGLSTTTSHYTADYVLHQHPCPTPLDTQVTFRRITPDDGPVDGLFRAIEPLTDITMHSQTRFYRSGDQPFLSGDERLAGQPLFGPFERVRISSGVALLVEM